ncbi:hypothetical protein M1O12_04275 [Dehalococcoidia bacterium]|nr:hypothetical protein [Dehalococcoidia bacterium]MCL0093051.1 hypothetical protein [Dehalococcoidia bacterium]
MRELLRATLFLKESPPEEALCLAVKHFFHWACSTDGRLQAQLSGQGPYL